MTTRTQTTVMPSLAPPTGQGDMAHLAPRDDPTAIYCGARPTVHAGHTRKGDDCSCGAPICPTCLHMSRVYHGGGLVP